VAAYGLPVLYALFVWWFSTGLILWLDGLPRRTFRWSLLGATILALAALHGLATSSADASIGGAYLAFTCGLLIWGWHEISFLMGFVTGPRRTPCPKGRSGWRHFVHATETILHHELAILATALLVVALTWGGANQVGTWTFLLLWGMRLSAKLNVFLGVPNLTEEFLPEHLRYLSSYLVKKPMNLLFPASVTVATVIAALLVQRALAADASAFEVAGFTFLGALMALAILEHWFLVLPLPDAALWSWALRSRELPSADATEGPSGPRGTAAPAGFTTAASRARPRGVRPLPRHTHDLARRPALSNTRRGP
jgi:putative photosynthetic complex assembly protein 2